METIKDIIAEMREHSGEIFPPWVIYNEDGGIDVTLLVNRIEAAHKREAEDVIAATVKAAAESASEVYEPHTKSEQVSNAAKMREALVQCELFLGNVSRHGHPTLNPGDKCTACDGADELRGMVARALAEPLLNCEVGTAEEQNLRHGEWCRKHGIDGAMEVACASSDMHCHLCFARWEQMPYEEVK